MSKIQKAIMNPKKAFDYLKHRAFSILGHWDYKRFIVLTRSRTGSNMLLSFLNSHPNVQAQGEIFGKLNGVNYKEILARAFSKQPYYIKATGFKIFYYHPQDDDSCDIWSELANMQGLYVIHLKRRNILRTLTSRKIAGIQDVWLITDTNRSNKVKEKAVEFTVDELEKGFKQTRYWEYAGDRMFSDHQILDVYYENLVKNPQDEFEKITDLLGLPKSHPTTHFRKQNPEKLSELIINYEELKTAFEGSEWESFFED